MNLAKKNLSPSLTLCIILDLVGYASFSIPVLGEITDVIWAPLSAFIFLKTFGGKVGKIGSVLNLAEEILPFTDFLPSFSIAWLIRNGITGKAKSRNLNQTFSPSLNMIRKPLYQR